MSDDTPKKKFRLSGEQIKPLVGSYGYCIATDAITVDGHPVGFMYREAPDRAEDSGWRFMAGFEDADYIDNPDNLAIFDVNTIANYDESIIPFLDAPEGSVFAKDEGMEGFHPVADWDWQPADEE